VEIAKLELAALGSLAAFSEAGPMTLEDRRKVRPTTTSLRGLIGAEQRNIPAIKQLADELGVKAVVPQDLPPDVIKLARKCRSVLEPNPDA
jgi:hypothetical protein